MHPREVLLGSQAAAFSLPVVDHYSGVPERMAKSLALQAELIEEFGACVMDVTLDCEDGAPAGDEISHAKEVLALIQAAQSAINSVVRRIGVRVHAVDHAAFTSDVDILVKGAAHRLAYVALPKVESLQDIETAIQAIDAAGGSQRSSPLPLHVLLESPLAVSRAFAIAAHPRVQSLNLGLMDFVSAHGGAIPSSGMTSQGQFAHPLVLRAKTEIAAACHAHGKVPSHGVVTEFSDTTALTQAARKASRELGYTRMWSIHPAQIRPILAAFAPDEAELATACEIITQAAAAQWAPIRHADRLHDRASYRLYWQLIERAWMTSGRTGAALPSQIQPYFRG
jgi:citrate lyase subunit beta / citryl-CoA lyase